MLDGAFRIKAFKIPDERLVVAFENITAIKLAQKAILEEKDRADQYLNIAASIILALDHEGLITLINDNGARILECDRNEMIGLNWFDHFIPADELIRIEKIFAGLISGQIKETEFVENQIITKKGNRRTIRWHNSLIIDKNKRIRGIISSGEDITDKKEVEEALKESEARYRDLVEKSGVAIAVDDNKGNISYFNRDFARLFGYSVKEMKTKARSDLIHPDDMERVVQYYLRMSAREKVPDRYELKGIRKDGSEFWIETKTTVLFEGQEYTGTRNYLWDVSERKNAEEALKKSYEEIMNLTMHNESIREAERKQIARDLHDELGQFLTAVKMDVTWLNRKMPDERKELIKRSESTIKVINEAITSVQRISSELRPPVLDNLGLFEAIRSYAADYQKRTKIKVSLELPSHEPDMAPDLSITVYRIIQEAMTNTARHAQAKNLNLIIRENNNILEIELQDNGIGIPEEKLTASDSYGLISMRERTQRWNGKFRISRTEEQGTTLNIRLPLP
jgi:PAS domain S-box-containing protein